VSVGVCAEAVAAARASAKAMRRVTLRQPDDGVAEALALPAQGDQLVQDVLGTETK
jgi:hypothetical protein